MDELQEIETQLRRDLRHVAAPPGFAERVMVRIAEREAARSAVGKRKPRPAGVFAAGYNRAAWWTAAAAAVALAVGGGDLLHVRHQRQAAAAQAQVDLAMQLASHALNEVQTGLERSPAGRFTQLLNETDR